MTALVREAVAAGRIGSTATFGGKPCYLRLFLWADQQKMLAAVRRRRARGASALFVPGPGRPGAPSGTRLGDIHLCLAELDLENVAHEVQHALQHRQALHGPDHRDVIEQVEALTYVGGRADEELAYEAGRWLAGIVRWLASVRTGREVAQLDLVSTTL